MWRRYLIGNPIFLTRVAERGAPRPGRGRPPVSTVADEVTAVDGAAGTAARLAGADRNRAVQRLDPRLLAVLAALLASAVALIIAIGADVSGSPPVPAVIRTAAVATVLFASSATPPARVLARGELNPHMVLLVLPVGADVGSLALAVLGLVHVPLRPRSRS